MGGKHRPNVILIMADDLGWGDPGCYGGAIRTPNLDRLAGEGVRLTDYHAAAPICTPSRVGVLTGRYPHRTGLDDGISFDQDEDKGLSTDEMLLAQILKKEGYATWMVGKWHLGRGRDLQYMPTRRGFDSFFGHPCGTIDYFYHMNQTGEHFLYRDLQKVRCKGYSTDLFATESVRLIGDRHAAPFFMHLAFNAPHTPLQDPDVLPQAPSSFEKSAPHLRGRYHKIVQRMDQAVGEVLHALDVQGIREDTLVIFTSDHGAARGVGDNGPFRGGKTSLYEGGHRVSCLIRWPGVVPEHTEFHGLCCAMDLFATIAHVCGAAAADNTIMDGEVLLPFLTKEKNGHVHDWIAWAFDTRETGKPQWVRRALRQGPWKLHLLYNRAETPRTLPLELYHLDRDVSETDNLIAREPRQARRLLHLLRTWERDVGIASAFPA